MTDALKRLTEAARDWVEIDNLTSPPCTAEMLRASNIDLYNAAREFVAATAQATPPPAPQGGEAVEPQSRAQRDRSETAVEAVAVGIAQNFAKQDDFEWKAPDDWDFTWPWVDQSEVDFRLVAQAAITAYRAWLRENGWVVAPREQSEAMLIAAKPYVAFTLQRRAAYRAMITAAEEEA